MPFDQQKFFHNLKNPKSDFQKMYRKKVKNINLNETIWELEQSFRCNQKKQLLSKANYLKKEI